MLYKIFSKLFLLISILAIFSSVGVVFAVKPEPKDLNNDHLGQKMEILPPIKNMKLISQG